MKHFFHDHIPTNKWKRIGSVSIKLSGDSLFVKFDGFSDGYEIWKGSPRWTEYTQPFDDNYEISFGFFWNPQAKPSVHVYLLWEYYPRCLIMGQAYWIPACGYPDAEALKSESGQEFIYHGNKPPHL